MSITGFLLLLLIAAVAGAIGQSLAGYTVGGCIGSILVGFIGAFIGSWIASQFNLPDFLMVTIDRRGFPLFWAIVGATLFSAVLGWVSRPRRLV